MQVAENFKVWHTNLCDAIYRDQKFNQRKKFLFCLRLVLVLCNLIYLTRTVRIKYRYAMCKSNYKTCLSQKRKLVHGTRTGFCKELIPKLLKSRRMEVELERERDRGSESEQRTLNKPHAQFVNQQTKIVVIHIEAIQMFMWIANQLKTVNVFVM